MLKAKIRNLELDRNNYKRKWEESESKMKNLQQLFETARNDRNLCSKNLLQANVSDAALLLK